MSHIKTTQVDIQRYSGTTKVMFDYDEKEHGTYVEIYNDGSVWIDFPEGGADVLTSEEAKIVAGLWLERVVTKDWK